MFPTRFASAGFLVWLCRYMLSHTGGRVLIDSILSRSQHQHHMKAFCPELFSNNAPSGLYHCFRRPEFTNLIIAVFEIERILFKRSITDRKIGYTIRIQPFFGENKGYVRGPLWFDFNAKVFAKRTYWGTNQTKPQTCKKMMIYLLCGLANRALASYKRECIRTQMYVQDNLYFFHTHYV